VDGSQRLTLRNRRFLRKLICPVRSSNRAPHVPPPNVVIPDTSVLQPISDPCNVSQRVDSTVPLSLDDENQPWKQGRSTIPSSPSSQATVVPALKTEAMSPTVADIVKNKPALPQSPTVPAAAKEQVLQLRRSTRVREPRLLYDPTTGGSSRPLAVSEEI